MTIHQIFCSVSDILADMDSGGDETRLYQSARDASRFLEEEIGWFIPVTQTIKRFGNGRQYFYPRPPVLSISSITNDGTALVENTDYVFMRQMWTDGPYLGLDRLSDAPNFTSFCELDPDSVQITGTFGLFSRVQSTGATLAAALTDSAASLLVDNGAKVSPGMILKIENEQILVTGWGAPSEEVAYLNGALTASADQVTLDDATDLNTGEVLRIDFEQVKIRDKRADALALIRSWNGSGKVAHADETPVDVYRRVNIERAVNGTTAASHASGTAISRYVVPDDIKFLAVEIATLMYNKARSGYQGRIGKADLGEIMYNDAFPQYDIERIKNNYWIGKS